MDPNGPFPGSVVDQQQESRSLRDNVAILRRRAWMIVFVAVITTASALAFSLTQTSLYQATASVLVNNQSLIATLQGITPQSNPQTADRDMQTQALFAQTKPVLKEAVQGNSVTTDELRAESSVTPDTNADVLIFAVQNHDPGLAKKLANQYAKAYVDV